jgi:hypothetical protein
MPDAGMLLMAAACLLAVEHSSRDAALCGNGAGCESYAAALQRFLVAQQLVTEQRKCKLWGHCSRCVRMVLWRDDAAAALLGAEVWPPGRETSRDAVGAAVRAALQLQPCGVDAQVRAVVRHWTATLGLRGRAAVVRFAARVEADASANGDGFAGAVHVTQSLQLHAPAPAGGGDESADAPAARKRARCAADAPTAAGGGERKAGGAPTAAGKRAQRAAAPPAAATVSFRALLDARTVFVDSPGAPLCAALAAIAAASIIAIDTEGVRLSRTGQLTLLQVATASQVFIFDILALGPGAFAAEPAAQAGAEGAAPLSLRRILEDEAWLKLAWDVRRDSDALLHQCGVTLKGVLDVQLAAVALRRAAGETVVALPGLPQTVRAVLDKARNCCCTCLVCRSPLLHRVTHHSMLPDALCPTRARPPRIRAQH